MDWDNIYQEMAKEKVEDTIVSNPITLRKIKDISKDNRVFYLEYHRKQIEKIQNGIANLNIFKYDRSIVFNFLTFNNEIPLNKVNQDCLIRYFLNYYTQETKGKLETRVRILKEFFACNEGLANVNISLDLDDLVTKTLSKAKMPVPDWGYYPDLKSATTEQKEFYEYWLDCFRDYNYVDIDGVLAYPFVYLYDLVETFVLDKDIEKLEREFSKLDEAYGSYPAINGYIKSCTADAYLILGDYDRYWSIKLPLGINYEDALNIKPKCTNKSIDGEEFLIIVGNKKSLTALGKENLDNIKQLAGLFLKDFEVQNGSSVIEYFVNHFNYWDLTEEDFEEIKKYITYNDGKNYKGRNYKTKEEWFEILKVAHLKRSVRIKEDIRTYEDIVINNPEKHAPRKRSDFARTKDHNEYIAGFVEYNKEKLKRVICGDKRLFNGVPLKNSPHIDFKNIPQIISEALEGKLQEILRECENTFREESGIPRIGEGWVNETLLFYRIKEAFPKENIVHHGRPKWLGIQHLDIFFPDRNIGIEYQGDQHSKPIEYFGGSESFEEQKKRDAKKQSLCTKNGCRLINVYPDYKSEEVIRNIEQFF